MKARGTSLVEALVALLVLALGMLAVVALQGPLRRLDEHARLRGQALQAGILELEALREVSLGARDATLPADVPSYAELGDAEHRIDVEGAQLQLRRSLQPWAGGWRVHMALHWQGRDGDDQLHLHSLLPRADAGAWAAITTPPLPPLAALGAAARHSAVPEEARRIRPGTVVFKPEETGTVAWLLEEDSGAVRAQCVVAGGLSTAALREADLQACTPFPVMALLLSGDVRATLVRPPDQPNAAQAADAVPDLGVALTLSSSPHLTAPLCATRRHAARLSYWCAIVPRSPDAADPGVYWSGRSELTGLPLREGGYRVCRYAADRNQDGRLSADEHPAHYQRVERALTRQHFLVLRFEQACPAGEAPDEARGRWADDRTQAHQP